MEVSLGRRFTFQDEEDLKWYFAGGLALSAAPPSSHGAVVEALMRGTPESSSAAVEARDLGEEFTREKKVRMRLAAAKLLNARSVDVLRAAFGPLPPGWSTQTLAVALEGWGPRPLVLGTSHVALMTWSRQVPFWEWVSRLGARTDKEGLALRTRVQSDVSRLWADAVSTWEQV